MASISAALVTMLAETNLDAESNMEPLRPRANLSFNGRNQPQRSLLTISPSIVTQSLANSSQFWGINIFVTAQQDPNIYLAAETVRTLFNLQRSFDCSNLSPYSQPGTVLSAWKSRSATGNIFYAFQVTFDKDSYFVRVSTPANNTNSSSPRFQFISGAPGPCACSVEDQLAVKIQGEAKTEIPLSFPHN